MEWPISEIHTFSDIVVIQEEDRRLIHNNDTGKQNKQPKSQNQLHPVRSLTTLRFYLDSPQSLS